LGGHEVDVVKFFQPLATQTYRSEAAEALRTRLVKYKDKLFTFIRHDGVNWNNNIAENAIRKFAYYRDVTTGCLKEVGIIDYLVLLSISHTCHYKCISFLKFLLSRERDIDAFCLNPRRKRSSPIIELYPKEFTRPGFQSQRELTSEAKPDQDENQTGSRTALQDG
jgi:hypothetical protein